MRTALSDFLLAETRDSRLERREGRFTEADTEVLQDYLIKNGNVSKIIFLY